MKKVFFTGKESFALRDVPMPVPGPGELLIKNAACGVCGTDIHIFHGEPGSAAVTLPVVLGHEYTGTVVEAASGVSGFRAGDHITVDPNIYCGVCRFCRNGKKQLCESMGAVGVNRDGGFAEYSVIPASQAFLLPAEMNLEHGAMAEPLACCIHGVDLAGIRAGDSVLVIGGGAIGLLMVQLAKLAGAATVILSEPMAFRRAIGEQLGADASFDPIGEDPAARVKALTGQDGVDVVIECVGKTAATKQAFDTAAKGATILLFSVPSTEGKFELPLFDVFSKELTIKGSFVNPDTHARAVALLSSGRVSVAPLITHRFGLGEIEKAIAMQMSAESIKVLVLA